MALLRRELAFRSLALRALFAIGGGSIVGIALALLGWGAWALVGQQVAFTGLSVAALWRLSPWRPGLHFSTAHFRELFSFGANVVGSDLTTYLGRNVDSLLIGAFLGTPPLGLYAVASRILDATGSLMVRITRRVTFPVFSRLQHDPERLQRAYLRVTRSGGAIIVPLYVALALVAPELTVLLFGQRWAESGPVATVLFLIGPVLSLQAISGTLLNAVGRPAVVFRFRLITALVGVLLFAIAVPFGIMAVAWAFVLRGYVLLPLILYWIRIYAGIPVLDQLAQLRGIALATLVMAAAVLTLKLGVGESLQPAASLPLELTTGALAFAAALWIVDRRAAREVTSLAVRALPGMERAQRRLRRQSSVEPVTSASPSSDQDRGERAP
jgi:PST family polysaccharide transporter